MASLGLRARAAMGVALAVAVSGGTLYAPQLAFAAPANDNFDSAQVVDVEDMDAYGDNRAATKEAAEPNHAGNAGGASIWYSWTAPGNAEVRIGSTMSFCCVDHETTDESHALAVYTGDSVSSLTAVASQLAVYPSYTFTAKAGVTYRIAIDRDANAPTGSAHLWVIPDPANDDFSYAEVTSGSMGSVSGTNLGASKEYLEPKHGGNAGGRSVWYMWTAPASRLITFDTEGSTFDTLLGVYTGSSTSSLTKVAGNNDCGGVLLTSCVRFNSVAGTTYMIAVDGHNGRAGNLSLNWGDDCSIQGTSGADVLTGTAGDDVICGLDGNDVIRGEGGNDTIIGGTGVDTVDFSNASTGVVANLITGTATGQGTDTLREIESITGSAYADKLDGDDFANTLNGAGGADGLWGKGGVDVVRGGDGTDTIGPGTGDDAVDGGPGKDTAHFARASAVTVDLTAGTATGEGSDSLIGMENITGSPGADRLTGSLVANVIQASGGNDTISGVGGADKLYGSAGNDALSGGIGVDYCDGGTGTDTATTCETRVAIP